jgi:hypothetical protein
LKIVLDIQENEAKLYLEFIKNLSFGTKAEVAGPNEVLIQCLLQSIENYETGKVKPTLHSSPPESHDKCSALNLCPMHGRSFEIHWIFYAIIIKD